MYLGGQQYFIGVVLDISRKVTTVKGRGDINGGLSQHRATAAPL